jgi:hypothetical protein
MAKYIQKVIKMYTVSFKYGVGKSLKKLMLSIYVYIYTVTYTYK